MTSIVCKTTCPMPTRCEPATTANLRSTLLESKMVWSTLVIIFGNRPLEDHLPDNGVLSASRYQSHIQCVPRLLNQPMSLNLSISVEQARRMRPNEHPAP